MCLFSVSDMQGTLNVKFSFYFYPTLILFFFFSDLVNIVTQKLVSHVTVYFTVEVLSLNSWQCNHITI